MSKIKSTGIRERQRVARENAILDAARQILLESGFEAMTMEHVADRAMITKPTLYAYFPNKLELAVASVVSTIHRADEEALRAEEGRTPLERWNIRIKRRLLDKFGSNEITVARPDEPIRAHPEFRRVLSELTDHLTEIVRLGQRDGEMNPNVHPKLASYIYLSVVANTGFEQLIADGRTTTDAALHTVQAQLVRGIRPAGNDEGHP